jgi:hypothetical protein
MNSGEIGWKGAEWINLALYRNQWWDLVIEKGNATLQMKLREYD